jgi:tripartite-type tricarboxylate transporter receptor subunit TctC
MKRIYSALVATSVVLGALAAQAANFPSKPINLVVPFPPGGVIDQTARPIGTALEQVLKEPIVIQNRAGAGGAVGMAAVANARPDGYTLLAAHPSISTVPAADKVFGRTPSFDKAALEPLALLVADPLLFVVKADAPWKTFEEFVADAKKRPGEISYSSSGIYGALHVPIEMLAHAAGIQLKHVAYNGGGPAITAVLGGHVAATVGAPAVLAPQIKNGELRALIGTGAKRVDIFPDVPTAIEQGYKDVEFYLWVGLFAPAKTPVETRQILNRAIETAAKSQGFVDHMKNIRTVIDYRGGASFREFLEKDTQRIDAAITRIGKVE